MQSHFMLSISVVLLSGVLYFFYAQRQAKKNKSLRDISKYPEWVEPVLETSSEEIADENILDEIITPIIPTKKPKARKTQQAKFNDEYAALTLYVMAPQNILFQSYELLQAISVNGFHYGKMQIFHYHENKSDPQSPVLFSLANAVEPGFFNLNEMGSLSCPGLILFMRLDDSEDLTNRFYLMLDIAKQLADDLSGEVLDEARKPFDSVSERTYSGRIKAYSKE